MKISKFVNRYLKPRAEVLPSYIKDTADFMNKIVALDIKSLYKIIPNHKGINAAKDAFKSVPKNQLQQIYYQIYISNIYITHFQF